MPGNYASIQHQLLREAAARRGLHVREWQTFDLDFYYRVLTPHAARLDLDGGELRFDSAPTSARSRRAPRITCARVADFRFGFLLPRVDAACGAPGSRWRGITLRFSTNFCAKPPRAADYMCASGRLSIWISTTAC